MPHVAATLPPVQAPMDIFDVRWWVPRLIIYLGASLLFVVALAGGALLESWLPDGWESVALPIAIPSLLLAGGLTAYVSARQQRRRGEPT